MTSNAVKPPALDEVSKWILRQIIQNQTVSSTMKKTIKQMISDNLAKTAERCMTFFKDQLAAKKSEEEIIRWNCHLEDFLIQGFRQRHLQLSESKDTPPPDDVHLQALRFHSDVLQTDLRLDGTVLLDRLIENDVMSEAGRQSILSRKTTQPKNAAFIRYASQTFNADTFKTVFLPALQEEHGDLATKLSKDFSNPTFSNALLSQCPCCKMREQIRIRKFATCLYKIGAITDASHLDLTSTDMSHKEKWNHLIRETKRRPSVLMDALKRYDASLYNQLDSNGHILLECTCQDYLNSTICPCSDSTDSDVARMSDFSDSSSQMHMETGDEIYTGATVCPRGDDTFFSGSDTPSLSGSEYETEGPHHGVHSPQPMMKVPFTPVNKDNPFTRQRRPAMHREQSPLTIFRSNNGSMRRRYLVRLQSIGSEVGVKRKLTSSSGSENEQDGPHHGIPTHQWTMKAPVNDTEYTEQLQVDNWTSAKRKRKKKHGQHELPIHAWSPKKNRQLRMY